jgi:ABC-type multidrug transport system fused ATPase/permease subunit
VAEEKRKTDYHNAWAEARELIWGHRKQLAIGFPLMVINQLAGFVLPASSKFLIDDVIGKHKVGLLYPLAAAAGIATLIQAATSFGLAQVMSIAAQRAIADMRKKLQAHILRLPVSYFDSTQSGILISRVMTDAEGIRNLVGTGLVQLVGGLITAVVALGVLFYLNWQMTTITLAILLSFGIVMAVAFKRLRPIFRQRNAITAEVTGRLAQAMSGVRIVKTYVAERREQKTFATGIHRLFRNIASTLTGISLVTAFSTLIVGIVGIVMFIMGGHAVLSGRMTLGDLLAYAVFVGLLAAPLIQIASIGTQISEAFAGLDRIREIRRMVTEDAADATHGDVPALAGDVRFDHVWFEYKPDTPVIRDVSFHAPAGSTTALVGSSGSGKSTLISLIMAFNHPQQGTITIDGRPLESLKLRQYRAQLGVVMQDNFLFDGTVGENIAFAKPGATMEEIREASRIAHCDEFISGFENGYDTIVGERGVRLSGGQRQRVAIARAILADPRILILDEATSSLDSESEALIRDGLRSLRSGRTTFVIAHRLSTIASANQILVLENGEILERGTQAELLRLGGRYKQLYDTQYRAEQDQFINPGEDFTLSEVKDSVKLAARADSSL